MAKIKNKQKNIQLRSVCMRKVCTNFYNNNPYYFSFLDSKLDSGRDSYCSLFVIKKLGNNENFDNTVYLPGIETAINYNLPTVFSKLTYKGIESRSNIFDKRVGNYINVDAFIYKVDFSSIDHSLDIEVNASEVRDEEVARRYSTFVAQAIGRMPKVLIKNDLLQKIFIHGAANNNNITYYAINNQYVVVYSDNFDRNYYGGTYEEMLFHELTHIYIDNFFVYGNSKYNKQWVEAKNADNFYISGYASNNPNTEDISETFLLYFAITYCREHIKQYTPCFIENLDEYAIKKIPNRIKLFDDLISNENLDMTPFKKQR